MDRFRSPTRGLRTLEVGELADLAQLTQFPGWDKLRTHYQAQIDQQKKDWGEALFRGEPPADSEVAFKSGFWAGVLALLDTPSAAEKMLTRELDKRKEAA